MKAALYDIIQDKNVSTGRKVTCDFEHQYIHLRQQEGRIYSDEEVALLPEIAETHPHQKEWCLRKKSAERLMNYLGKKSKALKILEVGCGNGWLSHQLSKINESTVVGLDINFTELQQAARVFIKQSNLSFFYGSLQSPALHASKFDSIIFAASLQYFQSPNQIINDALMHLKEDGEIHILDTHFYTHDEVSGARQRSEAYFNAKGFPQMKEFYFHHSMESILCYQHNILYNPNTILNKLSKNKNPFYWIQIKA